MDIFRMRCFISVAENLSLSKAAREQCITQPAMSAQMTALEKELGTQLLVRGRNLTLTKTGHVTLEHFRTLVKEYDEMRRAISMTERNSRELLRLGYHGPVAWAGVPDVVRAFRKGRPDVEVDITIDTWNVFMHMLEVGALDAAFMELSETEVQTSIDCIPLFDETIYVVVPPDHRLAKQKEVSVRDIIDETIMLYELETSPQFFTRLYDAFQRAGVKIEHVIRGNHHEATISLVLANCGITCMPLTFCKDIPGISYIPFSDLSIHMRYGIAYNRARLTPAVSEFIAFAQDWPWPEAEL